MTPNLRFNKNLTKKFIKAIPDIEDRVPLTSIKWNLENKANKLYGLRYDGWFKSTTFFLQILEDDLYRIVSCDNQPICGFFIIDDIDEFMEKIGVEVLEFEESEKIIEILKKTETCPNTGILKITDNEVFLYEHSNY